MSDVDESEIQHVYPHFTDRDEPEKRTFCGLEGEAQPLTDKPFCAKCHVSLLVALGNGYRVIGEDTQAEAHAVALEREAICKWLSSLPKVDGEPIEDVYTLEGIATLIRAGAHNQGGEREGTT